VALRRTSFAQDFQHACSTLRLTETLRRRPALCSSEEEEEGTDGGASDGDAGILIISNKAGVSVLKLVIEVGIVQPGPHYQLDVDVCSGA
jgi:hypothetical protein